MTAFTFLTGINFINRKLFLRRSCHMQPSGVSASVAKVLLFAFRTRTLSWVLIIFLGPLLANLMPCRGRLWFL